MNTLARQARDRLAGIIDPFAAADRAPPRGLWAFFRWAFAGSWMVLIAAAVLSFAIGVFEVISAWLLGRVVDAVAGDPAHFWADNWALMVGFVVFYLLIRPLGMSAAGASSALVLQPNLPVLTLSRLHRYVLGHDVTFFDNDFAGRLAQKELQTAGSATEATTEAINALFYGLASAIGAVVLVGQVSLWASLLVVLWIGVYIVVLRVFLPRLRVRAKSRANARAAMTGQIVDTITNIKTVKLFAHADHEDRAALTAMDRFRTRAVELGWVNVLFRFTLMVVAGALPVALIAVMVVQWQAGRATPGDFAAIGALSIRLGQMTGWISLTLMAIYSHLGEVEDGIGTLTHDHALTDSDTAQEVTHITPEVRFDNVTFAYGRGIGGVSAIDLTIKAGEKVGLVGASGAGKSTLTSLLLRLYDAEQGRILIGGHDLRDLTQESLRRQIGLVTQETEMFNRSARDNVLYGSPGADMADVLSATRRAEAHEFILNLRDRDGREGYDAYLGERGVRLSGGQRQRIALARALLKDAPILVLDEATSALDSEVEAQIQHALGEAMRGKTVLAIAHRLSTLADMDRIIVLDQGKIAEQGSHSDLLAQGGLYARYWNRQSGGFIGSED